MNIKINFHQMPHSDGIEQHAREKLQKVATLLKKSEDVHPISAELFLNAHPTNAHHEVELRVKAGSVSAVAHDKGADMYLIIDSVIDKTVGQLKRDKERFDDKKHKVSTPKGEFRS